MRPASDPWGPSAEHCPMLLVAAVQWERTCATTLQAGDEAIPRLLPTRNSGMMDRRTFARRLAAGTAASLLPRLALAQTAIGARNVVLVHGLFADGSCWSEVIARLQAAGLNATAVQNPLTTLDAAVASTQRVLAQQDGPTVLVGHSFAGMTVTEAGVDPKVSAVVYVAARAPDAGEDYTALAKTFPTPPASAGIVFDGDEGRLSEAAFLRDFAGDLPEAPSRKLVEFTGMVFWRIADGKIRERWASVDILGPLREAAHA